MTVQHYSIAPLSIDHVDRLVELDRLCFGGYWTRAGFEMELQRPPRDADHPHRASSLMVGAWTQDMPATLLGFAGLWAVGNEAHIITLGVHPEYRHQGIGRSLVRELLQRAEVWELAWATLEVRASNQIALQLYEGLGFEQLGQRQRYYDNPVEDALILWKRL